MTSPLLTLPNGHTINLLMVQSVSVEDDHLYEISMGYDRHEIKSRQLSRKDFINAWDSALTQSPPPPDRQP